MLFYRCITPKHSLSYDQRSKIATEFTDIYCGISAAPRNFVHVQFLEQDGDMEILDSHGNSEISIDTKFYIAGGNRAGRPPEVQDQILDGLIKEFCEIVGVRRNDVTDTFHGPESWVMEGANAS